MKSRNDIGCIRLDQGFRDMKNYRAPSQIDWESWMVAGFCVVLVFCLYAFVWG